MALEQVTDMWFYGCLKSDTASECPILVEQVSVSDTDTTLTLKCPCFIGNGASFAVKYLEEILGYTEQQIEKIRSVENYNIAFKSGHITMAYLETP